MRMADEQMAANLLAAADPRVIIIRKDKNLGSGSCTSIDECWSDSEILEFLDENKITTTKEALSWAYEQEGFRREAGLNASSGDENCHLVASYNEWQSINKSNIVS
tara:strand:+ start:381 stop:698 length:318 start_codon:yes stop_codon:yes gene_type:complete